MSTFALASAPIAARPAAAARPSAGGRQAKAAAHMSSVARNASIARLPNRSAAVGASRGSTSTTATMGGGGDRGPGLRREDEPEEAWMSKAEKEGKSPFKDPLAISAIIGIVTPFVILGIAIATGVVEIPAN